LPASGSWIDIEAGGEERGTANRRYSGSGHGDRKEEQVSEWLRDAVAAAATSADRVSFAKTGSPPPLANLRSTVPRACECLGASAGFWQRWSVWLDQRQHQAVAYLTEEIASSAGTCVAGSASPMRTPAPHTRTLRSGDGEE